MKPRTPCRACGALLLSALAGAAHADVIWSSGPGHNDHVYRPVSVATGITWGAAEAAAVALGGTLATPASAEENDFVFTLASQHASAWFTDTAGHARGPWLGGFQAAAAVEPAGGWQWVNGEGDFAYTAWAPGQPNNSGGAESRLQFYGSTSAFSAAWNDASATAQMLGYVVEWSTAIPEPGTPALVLFGLALSGLAAARAARVAR